MADSPLPPQPPPVPAPGGGWRPGGWGGRAVPDPLEQQALTAPAPLDFSTMSRDEIVARASAKERGVPYVPPAEGYSGSRGGGGWVAGPMGSGSYAHAQPGVTATPETTLPGFEAAPVAPEPAGVPVETVPQPPASQPVAESASTPTPAPEIADPWEDAAQGASRPLTLEPSLPSAQQDMSAIADETTSALERIGKEEQRAAEERARISKQFLADFDKDVEKWGSEEVAAREGVKKTQDELRAINEEIAKLPPIGDRRTDSQRVWGAVAIMLGGLADGLSGFKSNFTGQLQQQIGQAVERDIAVQRANLDAKRATAQDKLTEYNIARQYLGDTQQAHRFAAAMRGERFTAAMETQAASLQSKTARDAMMVKIGELRLGFRKEMNDLLQAEMGTKIAMYQAIAGGMPVDKALELFKTGMGTGAGGTDPNAPKVPGSKGDKAQQEAGKIDRDRLDAVYDNYIKIAPAMEANARLGKYVTGETAIPADATGTGKLWNKIAGVVGVDTESKEYKDLMADVEASRNAFLRLVSGAGISEQEGQRQWSEFGLDPSKMQTPEQLRAGLDRLNRRSEFYRAAIRAKDPEAYDEWEHRIGGGEARPVARTTVTAATGGGGKGGNGDKPKPKVKGLVYE